MVSSTSQVLAAPVTADAADAARPDDADWTGVQSRTRRLLAEAVDAEPAERRRLHDAVTVLNLPVARAVAARYRGRGEPLDDLVQAANVGLVKAVRGFDPDRGHEFLAYAVPVISGEVRRHFRDYSWTVRPPRALQQLQQQIALVVPRLSQQLGRTPRSVDVARELRVDVHDVLEALGADGCFTPASLDVRAGQGEGAPIGELLVSEVNTTASSDDRTVVVPALRRLPRRDQRILVLRYYCGLTQTEIAREVGISQMQVSRVLARALEDLRPQVV